VIGHPLDKTVGFVRWLWKYRFNLVPKTEIINRLAVYIFHPEHPPSVPRSRVGLSFACGIAAAVFAE